MVNTRIKLTISKTRGLPHPIFWLDNVQNCKINIKSNLHYTRGITPKRVTSGGAHLRSLAPGQHSSEETSQRWQADLTDPGFETQTSSTDSVCAKQLS